MCLRGYLIEGLLLTRRVSDTLNSTRLKYTKHSSKILNYFLWTLNNHSSTLNDFRQKGAASWFWEKSYFLNKADRFENSKIFI